MQSLRDWTTISSPSRELVERLAPVPGVKFGAVNGTAVSTVKLHRSLWPLLPCWYPADATFDAAGPRGLLQLQHLRDYQRKDVPFLLSRRASILGYEMRLGKTATVTCAHNPAEGPLLVIGPLIARDVWRHWIERVHGFSPVCLESKTDVALPGYPAYFVHFDILDAHSAFLQTVKPATLVIDEIHMLQARRSQRMSTCSLVAAESQRIIGLSGTPMWSNPRSMWPILNLLAPGAWGTEFEFCQRYMNATKGAYGWHYSGVNNAEEFKQRLSEVVIRRTWSDVAPSLPPTVNVCEPVAITVSDRNKCELEAEKARLAGGNPQAFVNVAAATASLRKRYGMLKVKRAVELAQQAIKDGHKVLLWTWHVEVAEALQAAIIESTYKHSAYHLTAEQTQDERAELIARFQYNAHPVSMVIPLAVGGVAIDLSSADVNIFVEQDWIPATNYQASMRVFKPGRAHANVWMHLDVPVERRLMEVLGANEACQTASGLGYEEIANKVLGGLS